MLAAIAAALLDSRAPRAQQPAPAEPSRARPTAVQLAWHDLELGMFVHLAPQTWQDRESDDGSTPLSAIDPAALDTDQWADVALSMGARYVVFVAKHEGGFCWWPTATTDYSVANTPWRGGTGDVMRDLAASCRKRSLGLGVYLSPADKHHGVAVGGRAGDPARQAEYERLFRAQLTELLTGYGEIVEVWFDGSLAFDVGDLLRAHAPRAVVFQGPQASIRWVGNEEGLAPYPAWNAVRAGFEPWGVATAADGDPDGDRWCPNECDARMRATWFWNSRGADTLKSLDQLVLMVERSVGRGAVLLLNHSPDTSGLIPAADAARAAELGAELRRRYGSAIADTSGRGGELMVQPSAPRAIDAAILMEDLREGERVRAYVLEALVEPSAGGTAWVELARGTAIGHKRIESFARTTLLAARLRVLESAGEPVIRRFSIHDTGHDSGHDAGPGNEPESGR